MKYLVITYIATSETYARHLRGFIETLPNLLPNRKKVVYVYSDIKPSNEIIELAVQNGIEVFYRYIEHLPWPIVALMKFKRVRQSMDEFEQYHLNAEYLSLYADSKVEFTREISESELFKAGLLTTVEHNQYPDYPTTYVKSVIYLNNRETKANLEWDYHYLQSGFFGGEPSIVRRLCDWCHQATKHDLANHRLPWVDDESYLNKWCHDIEGSYNQLPSGMWGCKDDPLCKWKDAPINIRDHSDAEWIKYCVKETEV